MIQRLPWQVDIGESTDVNHLEEVPQSSAQLCRGEFLRVLQDCVKLPDGKLAVREYIVHPGAVLVVPLLYDLQGGLRLVMECQFRYPLHQAMIEFPAGKLDPGEDSLHCAQRELSEETGYAARSWARAGVLHPAIAYSTEAIDVWFASGLTPGERHLDEGEFLDILTPNPDELMAWCRDGQITDAKTLAAALWLQNFLAGAWPLNWFDVL